MRIYYNKFIHSADVGCFHCGVSTHCAGMNILGVNISFLVNIHAYISVQSRFTGS